MAKLKITNESGKKVLFECRIADRLVPTVVGYLKEAMRLVVRRQAEEKLLEDNAPGLAAASKEAFEVTQDVGQNDA
jgi:hypothetical protein